ncbi:unnamed protein product [Ectocarpus fasciculatus]
MGCASSKPEEDYDSAGGGLGGTIGNEAADEAHVRASPPVGGMHSYAFTSTP